MTGGRVLILGLGRFGGGLEAARFLHRRGRPLRIADRSSAAELTSACAALQGVPDIEWALQREDEGVLDGVELVVVNPALPLRHPLLEAARRRGIRLTQEVELFLDAYPGEVVLVTGTNGKSTTATLLHAALQGAGVASLLGGNIGHSLLADEEHWAPSQVAVLEISSFQLERLDPARYSVRGAVLTRIGSDHLDRHGTLESYRAAKSIAAAMACDFLVHGADDLVANGFVSPCRRRVTFTDAPPAPGQVGRENGWITARRSTGDRERLFHEAAMTMLGAFQLENASAAATAALLLAAPAHDVGLALALAPPLPFRLQLLAKLDGVRIYDNSVSTEVESTRAALTAVSEPLHWVGGGRSKDGNYQRVATALGPHVRSAHLFGDSATPLAAELRPIVPSVTTHDRLAEALDAALDAATDGEAVVMSPAFASFDQYLNFRARAEDFHAWLRRRSGAGLGARG